MSLRTAIVSEARRWLDTPFHHQARERGRGADCGGLVGGVAVALGIVPRDWWQATFDPIFGGYSRRPSNGTLERICQSFMLDAEQESAGAGDVLLMRFKSEPQHLAIVVPYSHGGLGIVHALRSARKVCEHRLDDEWRARVVAAFRYPGVD